MDELGPMDFFTERDRIAIVGQLRMKEAASRNIADLYRAARAELQKQGVGPEDRRMRDLGAGIDAAEAEAEKTAREISGWDRS